MAIKIKKTADKSIPETLDQLADQGFQNSVLAKHFEANAKDARQAVMAYFASNDDDFDLTEKTVACTNGKLTFTERSSYDFDVDAIEELIGQGVVTLTTILQCCSFRGTDLKKAIGSKFDDVAILNEEKSKPTLSFKPNADFKDDVLHKAAVIEELGEKKADSLRGENQPETKNKKETKKATKKKSAAKKKSVPKNLSEDSILADSIAKAESLASKGKKENKASADSVEAELEAMLGE